MGASMLFDSVWTPVLAFVGTLVGCLLATHCLVRAVNTDTLRKRVGWLLVGSWGLTTAAVWDMFFIATTDLRTEGLHVRYFLVPIIATIIAAVLATTAVLLLIMSTLSMGRILGGGAVLGLAIASSSFQALHAVQTNGTITFHVWILIASAAFGMLATPLPLAITLRSRRRGALTGAAVLLAVIVTVTQYVNLYSVDFGHPVAGPITVGLLPATVIIPVALAFVVRVVLLLLVMLAGTGAASRLSTTSSQSDAPTH